MAIAKMDKLTIVGLASEREALMESLMRMGVVEIESQREDVKQKLSSAERQKKEQILVRLEQTATAMKHQFPADKGGGKTQVTEDEFIVGPEREKKVLSLLSDWERNTEKAAFLRQDMARNEEALAKIQPWHGLDMNLATVETERTETIYGVFADEGALAAVQEELAEVVPTTHIEVFRNEKDGAVAAVVTMKEDMAHVRVILQAADFHQVPVELCTHLPDQTIRNLEERNRSILAEGKRIEGRLREIAAERPGLLLLADNYRVALDLEAAEAGLGASAYTFWLSGWVLRSRSAEIIAMLQEKYDVAISKTEGKKGDVFPIHLQNNRFAQAYEVILKTFGAPHTAESDPTPVMAPFYMLLFGMMLSDVGYGALLVAACAYLLFKKKIKGGSAAMVRMLFISGMSSVVWGFVFGGFFGDMVTVLSNGKASFPTIWFNPLDDAVKLMIFSMLFGIIHLFFGMGIGIRNAKLQGKFKDALMDIVPWYFIVGGLTLMLGGSAGGFEPATGNLIGAVGKWMAIAGAAVVVLFAGRPTKNPISRLFKGALGLYDITSYFSDILSYTRILALVLATSVIAMVVNKLGFLMGPSVLGYIVFIIVGIFGHLLNLALSALSAYVHSSRLQYVEMFSKFFEGGGRYFKPFRRNTKYVDIEESAK